ncbi:glycosyltransferase family 2 protein, partial [Candidatus Parcubacteria bacterium]|nr:glycosyltransferase family 2 protein [Candidatus Sungbacteria bacterium]MBI4385722.1 glycosyltransferase family 2 protein [Candidatus Parcubacteria bacterium]
MIPRVTILILNWNGGPDTVTCLDSLKELRYPNFHVIVLDNASSDNSWELFAKYPKPNYPLEFIQTGSNLGFGGGNNVGLRKALAEGTDYVWLLNNDSAVTPEALHALIAAAESNPTIGIAGPLALTMETPARVWFAGGTFNWLKTRGTHRCYGELADDRRAHAPADSAPIDVDYVTGGIMLIKRAVFDDIGLLPGDYFLYYEDADFNTRAAKQSWRRILVPQAVVYHKGSASAKAGSPNYQYYHLRNGLM